MINNFIIFFPEYCTHVGALLSPIPPKLKRNETILEAKYEDIIPKHILKKGSKENLDDFLSKIQKFSNKKNG